jgi:hypothetical protein
MLFRQGGVQTSFQVQELIHNFIIKPPGVKEERGKLLCLGQQEKDGQSWTDQQEQGQPHKALQHGGSELHSWDKLVD